MLSVQDILQNTFLLFINVSERSMYMYLSFNDLGVLHYLEILMIAEVIFFTFKISKAASWCICTYSLSPGFQCICI